MNDWNPLCASSLGEQGAMSGMSEPEASRGEGMEASGDNSLMSRETLWARTEVSGPK